MLACTEVQHWAHDYLWSPYGIGQTIIFLSCGFFQSFFPRLISAVGDWMSTILPHMVWPQCKFRMQVWNVLHAARWRCRTQETAKNETFGHHRTTLSSYIFATEARINNRKQEGQHPLTGQRAANFRLLANQWTRQNIFDDIQYHKIRMNDQ